MGKKKISKKNKFKNKKPRELGYLIYLVKKSKEAIAISDEEVDLLFPLILDNRKSYLNGSSGMLSWMHKRTPYNIVMPKADYSKSSLDYCLLSHLDFTRDSILPEKYDFFQNLKDKTVESTKLTENCIKNIHLYDLNSVTIDLSYCKWYEEVLTENQINLIIKKYRHQLGANIILPKYWMNYIVRSDDFFKNFIKSFLKIDPLTANISHLNSFH